MDEEHLHQTKERLLKMRKEVMKEVQNAAATSREIGQDGVPDIGDMSANTYSRDVLLNLSEGQRQKIRDIDAALDRLAQGEYGICVRCGDDIAERRMEVRPFSRYCIECKTDVEKFGE
jgi:RNA polymerase-binding transcription factor